MDAFLLSTVINRCCIFVFPHVPSLNVLIKAMLSVYSLMIGLLLQVFDACAISDQVKEEVYKCYPNAKRAHLKTGGNFPYLCRSAEVNLHLQVSRQTKDFFSSPFYSFCLSILELYNVKNAMFTNFKHSHAPRPTIATPLNPRYSRHLCNVKCSQHFCVEGFNHNLALWGVQNMSERFQLCKF